MYLLKGLDTNQFDWLGGGNYSMTGVHARMRLCVCCVFCLSSLCPPGETEDWRHLWAPAESWECRETGAGHDEEGWLTY